MEEIKSRVKRLTVTQICVLGVGGIWFFLTLLLLLFCLYANRQSRLETEEGGRMAMGHWESTNESGIEVRRVSEPYTRRQLVTVQLGSNGGVRKPEVAHHGIMQRGQLGHVGGNNKKEVILREREKISEREKRKVDVRVGENVIGRDRGKVGRMKKSNGIPAR